MKKLTILFLLFSTLLGAQDIRVFFTRPGEKRAAEGTPLPALVSLIDSAGKSVSLAVFDIDNPDICASLLRAKKRGVLVRVVTDSDNLANPGIRSLVESEILVVSDGRRPFMHNKFVVVDGRFVWTGSYNFTDNCTYKNNNNALLLESESLAAVYLSEFDEMFERNIFGNRRDDGFSLLKGGNRYYADVSGHDVNVYFSPDDDVEKIILARIKKARKSVRFMAFSFTSKKISEALIEKKNEGLIVSGIFEESGARGTGSQYEKLASEKIQIKIRKGLGVMHHKVFIIDEELVITGSYNFTKNASRNNDENIVIVSGSDIAAVFLSEFSKILSGR